MIESIKLLAQAALILAVCLARQVSAQSLLQITSPAEGATFVEGQVYTITIAADPAVQNIYVITQHPLPAVQSTPYPLQFTLALPIGIAPGLYQITAVGSTANEILRISPLSGRFYGHSPLESRFWEEKRGRGTPNSRSRKLPAH